MFGIYTPAKKPNEDFTLPEGRVFPYIGNEYYGPLWDPSKTAIEQDGFVRHFLYWAELIEKGIVSGAGPYGNWGGALIVFTTEVTTYEDAVGYMEGDPWAKSGHVIHTVQQWLQGTTATLPEKPD